MKPPFHVTKLQTVIADLLQRHQAADRLELTLDGQTLLVETIKQHVIRLAYFGMTDDGYAVLERDVLFFLDAEGQWVPYKTRYMTTRRYALTDTAGDQLHLIDPDNQAALAIYCDSWATYLQDEGWLSERVICVDPPEEPDVETLKEGMVDDKCEATNKC